MIKVYKCIVRVNKACQQTKSALSHQIRAAMSVSQCPEEHASSS